MSGFKLDTSGAVIVERGSVLTKYRWSDLSPFAQGYIEAALADGVEHDCGGYCYPELDGIGFSDLAPATLAAMLEDCERFASDPRCESALGKSNGSALWTLRKMGAGDTHGSPPVTLYLADDGKIHQREGGQ